MKKNLLDLFKDTFAYGITNVFAKVVNFLLLPIYTDFFTPEDYGVITMLGFISLFFVPLAGLGVREAVFRRFNLIDDKEIQGKVLSTAILFVLFSSLVILAIGFLLSVYLTNALVDDSSKYLKLTYLSLFVGFVVSNSVTLTTVLRAERRVKEIGVIKSLELIATIGITIWLVVGIEIGLEGIFYGELIGSLFGIVLLIYSSRKLLSIQFSRFELGEMLNYGLPFLPHRFIAFGSAFFTQFFIKNYVGLAETGLFSIANKFAMPLALIIGAIQSAWVPLKFQIHKEEKDSATIFKNMTSFYFTLIFILFVGVVIVGPEAIRLMTNESYYGAIYLFPFVILIHIARSTYFMSMTGFEFTKDTRPMPLISGTGFVGLIVFSYLLFPPLGIYSVIISTIASWLIMAVLGRYYAVKRFYVPLNFKLITFVLLSILGISFVVFFSQDQTLFLRLIISGIVLIAGLLAGFLVLITNKDMATLGLSKTPFLKKFNLWKDE